VVGADVSNGETTLDSVGSGVDEFAWLKDRTDPRVLRFLEEENLRTEIAMRATSGIQEDLYREFRARMCETDRSAAMRIDDFFYYYRTEAGRPYRVWARAAGRPDAEEEILLDENELAEGSDFFRLSAVAVSPDHRYLAFGYDLSGDEVHTIVVKDLSTGSHLPDRLEDASGAFAWAEDGRSLLYATRDDMNRAYRVYRHRLGDDPGHARLVYEESEPAFHLTLRKTRSRRFILIEIASAVTSETWVIDAHQPENPPRRFQPRVRGVEYELADSGDSFLVRTNESAKNFRLMRVPVHDDGSWSAREEWTEVLPHRPDVMLEGVEAFRDFLVLVEREGGLPRVRVWLPGREPRAIPMPEPIYTLTVAENPDFAADRFRYEYSSPLTPETVFEIDGPGGDPTTVKRQDAPNFDPSRYRSERIHAIADDGTEIPISLVYRAGLVRDGSNCCLLMGYGSYGISYEPGFSSRVPSLLDRGFVYAVAHVRGGGELGETWHDQGKMLSKKTTFTDFIRCAETLIEAGYTCSERLGIQGRSAGGLLMGAVTNMRPDLFATVIAGVPFVDVLSTMQDATIPLTVIEYEEWGDPVHPLLLSVRQRARGRLPTRVGYGRAARPPRPVLGAGALGGTASGPAHR
jgi:oligopeptidase B